MKIQRGSFIARFVKIKLINILKICLRQEFKLETFRIVCIKLQKGMRAKIHFDSKCMKILK